MTEEQAEIIIELLKSLVMTNEAISGKLDDLQAYAVMINSSIGDLDLS